MPHQHSIEVDGTISAVFAHRFVVKRNDGTQILADIGPHGTEVFALREGMNVELVGEMKPSELKVSSIAIQGDAPVTIAPKDHAHADAAIATKAVEAAGFKVSEPPHRKPKHFEVLAHKDGVAVKMHVGLDGRIRSQTQVDTIKPDPAKTA